MAGACPSIACHIFTTSFFLRCGGCQYFFVGTLYTGCYYKDFYRCIEMYFVDTGNFKWIFPFAFAILRSNGDHRKLNIFRIFFLFQKSSRKNKYNIPFWRLALKSRSAQRPHRGAQSADPSIGVSLDRL